MITEEPPEGVYNPKLQLEQIVIDPDNERQTYYEWSFFGLRKSIQRKGVITPIGVEAFDDGTHKVIYGNRRTLAARSLGLEHIKATVYMGITSEQRFEMQVAENATKAKIPLHETAENLWQYYKFLLEDKKGLTEKELDGFESYWDLPQNLRSAYSMADLSRRTGYSESKISGAFRYNLLNSRIKKMVESGKVSYSFVLGLGRIKDKNEQLSFLSRALEGRKDPQNPNPINSGDELDKAVSKYLCVDEEEFSLSSGPVGNSGDTIDKKIKETAKRVTKTLGNIGVLLTIDHELSESKGRLASDQRTLGDYLSVAQTIVSRIDERIRQHPAHETVKKRSAERGRSLKDRILSGEFDEAVARVKDPLKNAEYRIVPVRLMIPDTTQPRQTFTGIEQLAKSISKVGILSPPLVRPRGESYSTVVGHRRTEAARYLGLENIGVLVANLTDRQVREIQYEEDIFERVNLAERAEKLLALYKLKKEQNGEYSLRNFAKEHKELSVDVVMRSIVFASLPPQVKMMHERGLLNYATSTVIGEEATNEEANEEWIINWAIKASLLGYKGKETRNKIVSERHQTSFEDIVPDLFGGDDAVKKGRGSAAADQTRDAVDRLREIEAGIRSGLSKDTLEACIGLVNTYNQLI